MLFVKSREGNIVLEDYKIYAVCPRCNTDVPVNLSNLLKHDGACLYSVEVFCRKCSIELGY